MLTRLGRIDCCIDCLGDPWNARLSTIAANVWRGEPLNATPRMATFAFQRGIPGSELREGAAPATLIVPSVLAAVRLSCFGLQRRAWQQGGDR